MGKVIFDISMSLDGFITGANVSLENGLGDGGEQLHDWGFKSTDPLNLKVVEGWSSIGAVIMGRTTYNLSIPHWGANGPTGDHRAPTVIVSHSIPERLPDNHVYHFAYSVEEAVAKAKELAGDKDISTSGADIPRQLIKLGLVDELMIHVIPVLFGSGTHLFEDPIAEHIWLEPIEVIETKEAIHTRFRVKK